MTSEVTPIPIGGLPISGPLVRPIAYDELPIDLAERLAPRVRRLGYLGAFFAFASHQPTALSAFYEFTEALKAALPDNLTETVALAASAHLGNAYEAAQHRSLARSLGLSAAWISAAATGRPEDTLCSEESVVRQLTIDVLTRRGRGARPAFQATVDQIGDEQAIAVLLLIGRYAAHGLIANTLDLTSPVASAR